MKIWNVNVEVSPAKIVSGMNCFSMDGGARTVTVSEPVLFVSLISMTWSSGSALAVLARLPTEEGVTANVTLNEPPTGNVTAPFAAQDRAVPVIEQSTMPVGGVLPFVIGITPSG